jgi:hypothetical protein
VQYTHFALPLDQLLSVERLPYDHDASLAVFGQDFEDTNRAVEELRDRGYRHVSISRQTIRRIRLARPDRARLDPSPSKTGGTQTQSPRDEGPVSGHVPSGRKASDVVQPLALLDVVGYIRLPCGRDSNPAPGRCPVQRAVRDAPGAANSSGLSVALQ